MGVLWEDDAILLRVRRHGERSIVAETLTRAHGRAAGFVKGGLEAKKGGGPQPGDKVRVCWRARLEDQLGRFSLELTEARAVRAFGDRGALAALSAALDLACLCLPEREAHPDAFGALSALVDALDAPNRWPLLYVEWEHRLLEELGYGLDLSACAATGERSGLIYVSPRTGRAVSATAGAPYRDRLLPLPAFFLEPVAPEGADLVDGLRTLGHFLERRVLAEAGATMPDARTRLVHFLAESGGPDIGSRQTNSGSAG